MNEGAERYRRMADWLEDFALCASTDESDRSQAIAAANALRRAMPWLALAEHTAAAETSLIEGVESAGAV